MRRLSLARLSVDPERALLFVLDAALDSTTLLLLTAHPPPDDPEANYLEHRLADHVLTDSDQLRRSLAAYLELLDRTHSNPDSNTLPF